MLLQPASAYNIVREIKFCKVRAFLVQMRWTDDKTADLIMVISNPEILQNTVVGNRECS